MINWKLDLRLLSFIVLFIGLLMGIPTALAFNYQETDAIMGFLAAYAAIAVFCTTILISTGKSQDKQMLARDGYLVVTLTWVIATAFSAIPLVASGAYVDYPSAYFEIMSGFTTTGATVLPEIESLPKSILFWRSQTNWLGGMGIVVLFVACCRPWCQWSVARWSGNRWSNEGQAYSQDQEYCPHSLVDLYRFLCSRNNLASHGGTNPL